MRQIAAANILVDYGGRGKAIPVSRAMIEAGYDETTAKNPSKLTDSKGFILIMEQLGIDDNKLGEVLRDGLAASTALKTERVEGIGKGRLKTEEVIYVADHQTRHRYLETGLRLKGLGKSGDTNINFYQMSRELKNEFTVSDAI